MINGIGLKNPYLSGMFSRAARQTGLFLVFLAFLVCREYKNILPAILVLVKLA